jgi:hypothetical protein
MTDTCDKAHKERQILTQSIMELAIAKGISKELLAIFELDCCHLSILFDLGP